MHSYQISGFPSIVCSSVEVLTVCSPSKGYIANQISIALAVLFSARRMFQWLVDPNRLLREPLRLYPVEQSVFLLFALDVVLNVQLALAHEAPRELVELVVPQRLGTRNKMQNKSEGKLSDVATLEV